MKILGISAYYHDAVALIENGKIITVTQKERFSRAKEGYQDITEKVKDMLQEKYEVIDLGNWLIKKTAILLQRCKISIIKFLYLIPKTPTFIPKMMIYM